MTSFQYTHAPYLSKKDTLHYSPKFGACAGQAWIVINYVLPEKSFSFTMVRRLKEFSVLYLALLVQLIQF